MSIDAPPLPPAPPPVVGVLAPDEQITFDAPEPPTAPAAAPAPPTPAQAAAPAANRSHVHEPAPAQPARRRFSVTLVRDQPNHAGPLKAMIYGLYGSGKTYLAGTANAVPRMREVIYLDVEGGGRTIAGMGIDSIPCPTLADLEQMREWLNRHAQLRNAKDIEGLRKWEAELTGEVPETPKQYRTVILDSLSEVAKLQLLKLSGVTVGKDGLESQIDALEGSGWGELANRIGLLIRTFRDLPYHVIFVASAVEKEDELKRRFYQPNFNGKMAKDVQGFLDLVAYLMVQHGENGQSRRVLALTPGRNFDAKHRWTGVTATHLVNPTMADIFALHTGEKKA